MVVVAGPGRLQDIESAVSERREAGEDGGKIGVAPAQRHRDAAPLPVLDVDVDDAMAVGRELLCGIVTQRRAVADVVGQAEKIGRQSVQEFRHLGRGGVTFEGDS